MWTPPRRNGSLKPLRCAPASTNCHTLPLADFGAAGFTAASAVTTTGHRGSITDRQWTATRISLAAGGRQFVSDPGAYMATAVPSAPTSDGSAFTVTYRGLGTPAGPVQGHLVAGDRLIRPGALTKFLGLSYVPLPEGPHPVM